MKGGRAMCQTKYLRCEFYHAIARLGAFYEIGRHNCLALKKKIKKKCCFGCSRLNATRRGGAASQSESQTHTHLRKTHLQNDFIEQLNRPPHKVSPEASRIINNKSPSGAQVSSRMVRLSLQSSLLAKTRPG